MAYRWRCRGCNPPFGAEFEANEPGKCPRCGRVGIPFVLPLTDVHFLAPAEAGPIPGSRGRYVVACQPKRDVLAAHAADEFAASHEPWAVTCPSCMGTTAFRAAAAMVPGLQREMERRGAQVIGGGCC